MRALLLIGGVVALVGLCVSYYFHVSAVRSIDPVEIGDISLQYAEPLVTASDMQYRYRSGSEEITRKELQDGVWSGLKLTTVFAKMDQALRIVSTRPEMRSTCVCAPQSGFMLRIIRLADRWMFNPVLVAMPLWSRFQNLETSVDEVSTLFPSAAPIAVVRHKMVKVRYTTHNEERTDVFEEEDAFCIQACMQLFDGKTVFDLQPIKNN